jgi:excisionase family DNA binding protein
MAQLTERLIDEPESSRLPAGELMLGTEVARVFRVNPRTVAIWAINGKLACIRTIGGHRRYWRADVEALLNERRHG